MSNTASHGKPMPTNKMFRFSILIGTWNTSGEVLETEASPAGTLSATDSYRWLPGQHFIIHEADARFGGEPSRSLEVVGYDRAKKKHISRSYDDQGVSEVFDVSLKGKNWSISGATVRFNGKFSSNSTELTGLWEMKGKKAGWQPWIRLELVRA